MSYIKLDRGICDWEWFTDANTLKVWIYLLTNARFTDGSWKGIPVKKGQLIIGRKALADRLKMTESEVRTCLKHLKKTQEITIKSTNKNSLITIVKWGFYQGDEGEDHQQTHQQIANKSPTNRHNIRMYRREEGKNIYDSIPVYDPSINQKMDEEEKECLLNLMKRS